LQSEVNREDISTGEEKLDINRSHVEYILSRTHPELRKSFTYTTAADVSVYMTLFLARLILY
jgi:hypothetical protein